MSFVTDLTRAWLTRSTKPFIFKNEYDEKLFFTELDGLGLYVHIPFCAQICNFCPYCKVRFENDLCDRYIDALIREIHMVGSMHPGKRRSRVFTLEAELPHLLQTDWEISSVR